MDARPVRYTFFNFFIQNATIKLHLTESKKKKLQFAAVPSVYSSECLRLFSSRSRISQLQKKKTTPALGRYTKATEPILISPQREPLPNLSHADLKIIPRDCFTRRAMRKNVRAKSRRGPETFLRSDIK